jgi:hypothetical protein
LTASNGAVDAVHTYVVASIGVNLVASTVATGLALLRENGAISALTDAQKTVINAAHASTLANLAADLSGRNANEALDDPIVIAAAGKAAADGVKAAWQNVSNLQARAASTFAGTGPNGGGFAMTFAAFAAGVGDVFQIGWAAGGGVVDGLAMIVNAATFHQITWLDSYVDGVIEDNGGTWSLYGVGNISGHIGVYAGYAAVAIATYFPTTVYHFTSTSAANSINASGVINMGGGLFGRGVYASSFNSPFLARLMGAASTEAVFSISVQGITRVPTLIPGAWRILHPIIL